MLKEFGPKRMFEFGQRNNCYVLEFHNSFTRHKFQKDSVITRILIIFKNKIIHYCV